MKIFCLLILFTSSYTFAIELVIGGKTYYIEKFEIQDNGERIIVPYTIHLDQEAHENSANCTSKAQDSSKVESTGNSYTSRRSNRRIRTVRRRPASSNSGGSVQDSAPKNSKTHPFKSLMNDLDGGFKSLRDQFKRRKAKKPYKQDFR